MAGHLDDMAQACGINFSTIAYLVNEWRNIRDLIYYTNSCTRLIGKMSKTKKKNTVKYKQHEINCDQFYFIPLSI